MPIWRSLTSIVIALLTLAAVQSSLPAHPGQTELGSSDPIQDLPTFIKLVTVTIESSPQPLTPSLGSLWQVAFLGVAGPVTQTVSLLPPFFPEDAHDFVVTATGGTAALTANSIVFVITDTTGDLYFSYHSHTAVTRQQNRFYLNQYHRASPPYRLISTVVFTSPYSYGGYYTYAPTVTTGVLNWDLLPPMKEVILPDGSTGFRHLFEGTIWLIDSRLNYVFLPLIWR